MMTKSPDGLKESSRYDCDNGKAASLTYVVLDHPIINKEKNAAAGTIVAGNLPVVMLKRENVTFQ